MLGKLIKYDLKYIYKQLAIFYCIIIFCAIIARLTNFNSDIFIVKFIHEFTQGCAFGFAFGCFINASMRMWARLRLNFYGNESYLTHTLPLSRGTLWTAKFLSSIIVTLLSIIVCIAAFLIMFFSEDFIRGWDLTNPDMLKFYGLFILAAFCQITYIIQSGLTGIILGHLHNYNRAVHSVIYGLAVYFAGGVLLIAGAFLWAQFDPEMYKMIFQGSMPGPDNFNQLLSGIAVGYIVLITITYFVNRKLLARGVDVD